MNGERAHREAVGDWLRASGNWQYWASLTFTHPVPEDRSLAHLKAWLRFAAKDVFSIHVPYTWARDEQQRGALHYHVLLGLLPGVQCELAFPTVMERLRHGWSAIDRRCGDAVIEPYDPNLRATHYQVVLHRDWDINVACTRERACRRAAGCRFAPGPWN